jgi:hypothetical protein
LAVFLTRDWAGAFQKKHKKTGAEMQKNTDIKNEHQKNPSVCERDVHVWALARAERNAVRRDHESC